MERVPDGYAVLPEELWWTHPWLQHLVGGSDIDGDFAAVLFDVPDEVIEDDILIKPDKNPNRKAALALYPALHENVTAALTADADVVLVWGEGFDLSLAPAGAKVILLGSYEHAQNAQADVFIPISIQTERSGHYTNFAGVVTPFEACFPLKPSIVHAEALFATLAVSKAAPAMARV